MFLKLIVILMLIPAVCFSAPKKCPPKCKHRSESKCVKTSSTSSTLWSQVLDGFELNAGYRWQAEEVCPTLEEPTPPIHTNDPFYLGAGLRLPFNEYYGAFGNFDRDFDKAPKWQARAGVYWAPFKQ